MELAKPSEYKRYAYIIYIDSIVSLENAINSNGVSRWKIDFVRKKIYCLCAIFCRHCP